ncbi:MAG: Zn-dependent protease [Methylophagaceae bacterium]|jgi:Zn-dependent protease
MDEFSLAQKVIIWAIPVLFAVTLHEVAHGWAALQFGDRTAQMLGRLTLNPIKHIDPVGTILVPGLLVVTTGFVFGWAKPVPVNARNMRNAKTNMAWVALAGPMANLLMALFWSMLVVISFSITNAALAYMGMAGIFINTMLMLLNLLPLPPLDGGRILVSVLPGPLSWKVSRIEPYGFMILLALLYFGIVGMVLWPLTIAFIDLLPIPLSAVELLRSLFN